MWPAGCPCDGSQEADRTVWPSASACELPAAAVQSERVAGSRSELGFDDPPGAQLPGEKWPWESGQADEPSEGEVGDLRARSVEEAATSVPEAPGQ